MSTAADHIRALLDTPDLNLGCLETETQLAIERARLYLDTAKPSRAEQFVKDMARMLTEDEHSPSHDAPNWYDVMIAKAREICCLPAPLPRGDLFNCCPNEAPPDWSRFSSLEIGGCVTVREGPDEYTEGGIPYDLAEFFTVYGRLTEFGSEAITDCLDLEAAKEVAVELSRISGLPITN